PTAPPGVLSRLRRRRAEPTAADRFWDEARGTDPDPAVPANGVSRRVRPEAGGAVVAVAERLDRDDGAAQAAAPGPIGSRPGGSGAAGALPAGHARAGAAVPALPTGFSSAESPRGSRVVDTMPVVDPGSEPSGDQDAVLVPSRTRRPAGTTRRAEMEVVAGRPVWVVYQPSRGLVVGDGGDAASRTATG
ncbi:MAG: hypothetical protein ACRDRZ_14685, partial [Pseudonocardiaceae bacterium]